MWYIDSMHCQCQCAGDGDCIPVGKELLGDEGILDQSGRKVRSPALIGEATAHPRLDATMSLAQGHIVVAIVVVVVVVWEMYGSSCGRLCVWRRAASVWDRECVSDTYIHTYVHTYMMRLHVTNSAVTVQLYS